MPVSRRKTRPMYLLLMWKLSAMLERVWGLPKAVFHHQDDPVGDLGELGVLHLKHRVHLAGGAGQRAVEITGQHPLHEGPQLLRPARA